MAPFTTEDLIEAYLKDQELAWSRTTLRSELARLNAVAPFLRLEPKELFTQLQSKLQPYSLKTLFIRLAAFETWCQEAGHSEETKFRSFLKKHANLFKHAYRSKRIEVTFEEAANRVATLPAALQCQARALLYSGMRFTESLTYDAGTGEVVGKGRKVRKVYPPSGDLGNGAPVPVSAGANYQALYRALRRVGLTPHMLRKLWATQLGRNGVSAPDLCELAGWTSIVTAGKYLQANRDRVLQSHVSKLP